VIVTYGTNAEVLENPGADGMEQPAADEARVRTERAGCPAQQDAALAGAQAKPKQRGRHRFRQ